MLLKSHVATEDIARAAMYFIKKILAFDLVSRSAWIFIDVKVKYTASLTFRVVLARLGWYWVVLARFVF